MADNPINERPEDMFVSSDSGMVKAVRDRTVGDLVDLATLAINDIGDAYGSTVAMAVAGIGNELTRSTNDAIRAMVGDTRLEGVAMAYLTSVVAANIAVGVFTAMDAMKFAAELDAFQEQGGAE